ncbi:MAG: ATP-binding protein [Desulfobulbaceae bacterium]|nr:ATP-binding protein [Desulfobulbaceae bacterium]HIJ90316.1 PAS domain S-box protein [Deltaproteobacteria bacterium]
MKFRLTFLALGILTLTSIIAGGVVYFHALNTMDHNHAKEMARDELSHLDQSISPALKANQKAVAVLAEMWSIRNFFTRQSPQTLAEAQSTLDDFREAYHARRCCLINRDGLVVAASVGEKTPVRIGDDYSGRPFFQQALAGHPFTAMVQGITSKDPAINLSHPILSENTVLGVVLLTIPLSDLEEILTRCDGIIALTDQHNIIIASNKQEWLFKAMAPATPKPLADETETGLSTTKPPAQIQITFDESDNTARFSDGNEYFFSRAPLSYSPGWQINYFRKHDRLNTRAYQALHGKAGILLAGTLLCILGVIAYLFRQAEIFLRQREQAEKNHKAANLFLSQILDAAADGMRVIDNNCNIVQVNETFAAMTGMEQKDILGKKCRDIFRGAHCNTENCSMRQIQAGKNRIEVETHQESQAGKTLPCWLIAVPLYDTNGERIGILESFRDISQRIKTELALKKSLHNAQLMTEELTVSNKLLYRQQHELALAHANLKQNQAQILQQEKMASVGQLAAGVAHEINNPMGFISSNLSSLAKYLERLTGFIRALEEKLPQEPPDEELAALRKELKIDYIMEDAVQLVEESLDGADRVKKIVQGLKNFSRIDQAERLPADINECLDTTLNIVWNELKYKCEVNKDYGKLPLTVCNPQQLNQMFMNLLVNAAQSIETKGEIRIKTWADQDWIHTRISDTGCGIPQDKINRIFEPFYTSKEVGKGTGLGLSIAYDIVLKNHKGDIQVESVEGKGTTFTVKIPLIAALSPEQ